MKDNQSDQNGQNSVRLMLRVFVDVPSVQAALADTLAWLSTLATLEPPLTLRQCRVEPYWKIPEYQEVTLHFSGSGGLAAHSQLKAAVAAQWVDYPNLDAVWDLPSHGPATWPAARWAEVQIGGLDDLLDDLPEDGDAPDPGEAERPPS